MDRLSRKQDATLVVLVGPPDSGKTTLVSSIYEQMRATKISGLRFAGSQTLMAFEERCHLSRLASNLEDPATERTKYSEEQTFYHLRTRLEELPHSLTELFLLDVAGEGFRELQTTHDACHRLDALGRTDYLVVLLDGKRLKNSRTRHLAVEECINFLQCAKDSDSVADGCEVQVIVSKSDELPADASEKLLPEVQAHIRQRLADKYPKLLFAVVAARPDNHSPLENAHGVAKILRHWTTARPGPAIQLGELDLAGAKREAEAFGHRQPLPSTP